MVSRQRAPSLWAIGASVLLVGHALPENCADLVLQIPLPRQAGSLCLTLFRLSWLSNVWPIFLLWIAIAFVFVLTLFAANPGC